MLKGGGEGEGESQHGSVPAGSGVGGGQRGGEAVSPAGAVWGKLSPVISSLSQPYNF